MTTRIIAFIFLLTACLGCASNTNANTPVTWEQDEDEIVFHVYLSSEASTELMDMLNETVTFEQLSEFLVKNTDEKIPFFEGGMTAAVLVMRHAEIKAEMEKKVSEEGLTIEITGFKQNPVQLMKGALDFSQAPKYLVDFEPRNYPEIVYKLLTYMSGHAYAVEAYGRFTEK